MKRGKLFDGRSKTARLAFDKEKRLRRIKDSPREKTMWKVWFDRFEKRCPCSNHRSILCLEIIPRNKRGNRGRWYVAGIINLRGYYGKEVQRTNKEVWG